MNSLGSLRPTNARTGDLLFVSGGGLFSNVIKQVTGTPFSHLAVILELEDLYVWEATGKGVKETPWKTYFQQKFDFMQRLVNPGCGDVGIRRLTWPKEDLRYRAIQDLGIHCQEVRGRPYEVNKLDMFRSSFPRVSAAMVGRSLEDLSSIFCWEAAAAAWKALGLLDPKKPAHEYSINDFLRTDLELLQGVKLGPLEIL